MSRRKRGREKVAALRVSGYTGPIDKDTSKVPDVRQWIAAHLEGETADDDRHAA